ncbi:DUF1737 domain-containing protein [Asticcacaulis sp. DXS10W]|uniref:DUF1737 domain-containing protein n=1 Tax=Asticcacaulis currens TaxID=2984210 RepID=A0ABT5IE65_9CAUL|nr:DUF1737 domain-containing protein [Asticcacaulis currens]MDC7694257.1 DUF1737 domain-containing protein [Asticcacaulis currens]
MIAYRFITGPDDAEFCARVTALLNNGWDLAGPAAMTFDQATRRVLCGQPMLKDIPDIVYSTGLDLSAL